MYEGTKSKIAILPQSVINQISAGEVIERPANVVKELIENSIDAEATYLKIEIENAGKGKITVIDDGVGIPPSEVELAFERHATSKIKNFDDLFYLNTLGFRGEALPAISSVSRLKLISRTRDLPYGCQISLVAGKVIKKIKCGSAPGTSVEVKDLFFNTPARLKFLKSDSWEKIEIIRTVEKYSLAYPYIRFIFISDGKTILNLPKSNDPKERIFDLLGKEVFNNLIEISLSTENIKIEGYISKIGYTTKLKNQYLFVNNRPVFEKTVNHAINEAYRSYFKMEGYPVFIIFMKINPKMIDVNIHPTKREIKFSQEKEIYNLIFNLISNKLRTLFLPTKTGIKKTEEKIPPPPVHYKQEKLIPKETKPKEEFIILGNAFNTYIIVQFEDKLQFVDQHAASERVLYEKFLKSGPSNFDQQQLLTPVLLTLPPSEAEKLKPELETLRELGFDLEEFGNNSFKFKAYPRIIGEINDLKKFIEDFVSSLLSTKSQTQNLQPKERVIKAACKSAVKAASFLSEVEMYNLIRELNRCSEPTICPHGRPITLEVSLDELQKKFHRK